MGQHLSYSTLNEQIRCLSWITFIWAVRTPSPWYKFISFRTTEIQFFPQTERKMCLSHHWNLLSFFFFFTFWYLMESLLFTKKAMCWLWLTFHSLCGQCKCNARHNCLNIALSQKINSLRLSGAQQGENLH